MTSTSTRCLLETFDFILKGQEESVSLLMARNEAQSMRRRDNNTITRGGKIKTEFLSILRANIQIFKNGIFYRNKNIRLETAGRYYAHIGRIFNIISTGCLRVLGGVFDDRIRISTR